MNLDGLNTQALNLDRDLIGMIQRMDEHEKYRTKELMFSLLPAMIAAATEEDLDDVDAGEIIEGALNYAVVATVAAAVVGL